MASTISPVDASPSDVVEGDPAARFTADPSTTTATTMQPVDWEYVPEVENGVELPHNTLTPGGFFLALWSTTSSYPSVPGLESMDLRPHSPCNTSTANCRPRRNVDYPPRPAGTTAFIHIPYCKLDVGIASRFPSTNNTMAPVHVERVGLPRTLVQEFRARINLPLSPTDGAVLRSETTPHFDDDDEWVYSRCVMSDFTGVGEDEAAALSRQGSLCCWASIVLEQRHTEGQTSPSWDLGFILHRVGVCTRDPSSKTGGCPWLHN
ncbi:hypothetical protein QBC35DRAFT_204800 [Podospora australis]|uniref:Uncharacterized protein n=1 Tax=Podospora australis TaxID=1536484 RepID=A0AAN7AMT1_9PEZI|nr:hypothetical protein QBC35DRAFT_204800 [Podospora australis]